MDTINIENDVINESTQTEVGFLIMESISDYDALKDAIKDIRTNPVLPLKIEVNGYEIVSMDLHNFLADIYNRFETQIKNELAFKKTEQAFERETTKRVKVFFDKHQDKIDELRNTLDIPDYYDDIVEDY